MTAVAAGPPPRVDARFAGEAWRHGAWPALVHLQQAAGCWWPDATALRGTTPHHREMARRFAARWLDALSPASLPPLKPEAMQRTLERQGASPADGAAHALAAWRHSLGLPAPQGACRRGDRASRARRRPARWCTATSGSS